MKNNDSSVQTVLITDLDIDGISGLKKLALVALRDTFHGDRYFGEAIHAGGEEKLPENVFYTGVNMDVFPSGVTPEIGNCETRSARPQS